MAEKKTGKVTKETGMVLTNKLYTIVSKQNAKAIEAGNEDDVYMMKTARRKNQQWKIEDAGDGFVKIVNALTGKALDIVWEGTDNGAQIHQWEYVGGANQQWAVVSADEGAFKIKARASDRCLDIVEMSQEDGAKLQIWDDCEGINQQWIFKEVKTAAKASPAKTTGEAKAKKAAPKAKANKKESVAEKK